MDFKDRLSNIYEYEDIESITGVIEKRIAESKSRGLKPRKPKWDEKDVVLITYADQFREEGKSALATFKTMFDKYLLESFEVVHLLPFYPYSSDDGFSVIDYKSVNPISGDWQDLENLSNSTRIMFDYVCNHMSAKSEWFKQYLNGDPDYKDFFIEMDPSTDLSMVTRPRATPLLTPFTIADGTKKYIWTTFSDDQIDLNFRNPQVLIKMIDVLLFYLEKGAEYVRLDAVGFMWKEVGTTCMHLEKTHQLIKLFRDIIEEVAPGTVVITETNVPHKDNISYFGNGHDEAQMVYQFPLPPLVLYSLNRGNGKSLTNWAKSLELSSEETTFFNFLASHDGIGLNPVRGILPEEEIFHLVEDLKKEGALVSYKKNPDGSESPYEVNVTYLDALNKQSDDDDTRLKRFLLAHSILLTFPGVPAVYIQSILGSRNDYEGISQTGTNRSINRQKYFLNEIEGELESKDSLRRKVFNQLSSIIQIRKSEPLFHPNNAMEVMDLGEKIFAIKRVNQENESLLAVHNLTNENVLCDISGKYVNLISGVTNNYEGMTIHPYQFLWLKPIH